VTLTFKTCSLSQPLYLANLLHNHNASHTLLTYNQHLLQVQDKRFTMECSVYPELVIAASIKFHAWCFPPPLFFLHSILLLEFPKSLYILLGTPHIRVACNWCCIFIFSFLVCAGTGDWAPILPSRGTCSFYKCLDVCMAKHCSPAISS